MRTWSDGLWFSVGGVRLPVSDRIPSVFDRFGTFPSLRWSTQLRESEYSIHSHIKTHGDSKPPTETCCNDTIIYLLYDLLFSRILPIRTYGSTVSHGGSVNVYVLRRRCKPDTLLSSYTLVLSLRHQPDKNCGPL